MPLQIEKYPAVKMEAVRENLEGGRWRNAFQVSSAEQEAQQPISNDAVCYNVESKNRKMFYVTVL
jgi:hypothetical protein